MTSAKPEYGFWNEKSLSQMSENEWEALCDGCGRCCLVKLEDEDTGDIYPTDVSCKLLCTKTCRCKDYPNRAKIVDDCIKLDRDNVEALEWLPTSCAYRRIAAGQDLDWWHPLISGDKATVIEAGISVYGKITPEDEVEIDDLPDRIVDWEELE